MSEVSFVDESGITRLRGTLSPAPGGSQPFTGWTQDESDPANVDANGGSLANVAIDTAGASLGTSGGAFTTAGGSIDQAAGSLAQDDGEDSTTALQPGVLDLNGPTSFATLDGASGRLSVKPAAAGVALTVNGGRGPNGVIDRNGVLVLSPDSRGGVPAIGTVTLQDLVDALAAMGLVEQEPTNVTPPVASGTPQEGETVTSDEGEWSDTPTLSFAYQWQSSPTGMDSWSPASIYTGYNTNAFLLPAGLIGNDLRCKVTASNAGGFAFEYTNTLGPVTGA